LKKSRDKESFIRKPEYPGGKKALQEFIRKNLIYPKKAKEQKIEGTVYLSFKVDYDGSVTDVKILSGLGSGCDEEAARVVELLKYSVQKNRGSRLTVRRKMNIHFKLPPAPPKKEGRTVTYNYKSADKTASSGGYSYTVNLDSG